MLSFVVCPVSYFIETNSGSLWFLSFYVFFTAYFPIFCYVVCSFVFEDGELYDKEYVIAQKVQRTGVSFYEVVDWEYDERKKLYQPTIRRIVMIKNTNTQLSLNL